MSNVVEFVLKLKDLMSGGMQRAASTAQGALGRVNTALGRTQRVTGRSIGELNRQLDDLRRTRELSVNTRQIRDANREIDRLEARRDRLENLGRRRAGNSGSGGGGLLGMVGGMKGLVAGAGIAAATAGIGSSISQAMGAGAQKMSFEVMAGKQAGGKLFGDLTKFAKDSIFGNEVFQNAQTLKAFGEETEKVMPSLKMLGDVSMGNKDRFGALSLAFAQTTATGRLMGQDLLQYVNAGFNPLKIISEKTGISMAVLKEKMEKGAISAKMVEQAFQAATGPGGQFFDMTNKIAQTPFGKWEALKGQVSGLAVQFGTALMPLASKAIDFLGGIADKIPTVIGAISPLVSVLEGIPLGDMFSGAMAIFPQIVAGVKPVVAALTPVVKTVFGTLADFVKNQGPRLLRIWQAVAPVLANVANILGSVLSPALKIVGWLLEKVLSIATWVIEKIAKIFQGVTWLVSKVAEGVGWVMDKAAAVVETKTDHIKEAIKRGVSDGQIIGFFKSAGEKMGNAWSEGILSKYRQVAVFMDRIYSHLHLNMTERMDRIIDGYRGVKTLGEVVIKPKGQTLPQPPKNNAFGDFSSLGKTDKLSSGKEINGGGVRTVNITIHKFFDTNNVYVSSVQEGHAATGDKVAEELLRIANSVGENMAA